MAGVKRARGVGGRAGRAKGAAAGRGAGLALALAAAAGAVGGCQAPPGAALFGATSPADLAATRAECEGEGCDVRGGGTADLMPVCAPGSPKCDPEQNGLGVFVARDGRFCLPTFASGRVCVESFVNGPDGVKVRLSPAGGPAEPLEWEVKATFRPEGFVLPHLNSLESITTDRGRLVIKYVRMVPVPGGPLPIVEVPEDKLPWVWLEFDNKLNVAAAHAFQLYFKHVDMVLADGPSPRDPIERYRATFRLGNGEPEGWGAWTSLCADHANDPLSASFLGGNEVDFRSAKVTKNAQAVTMSCVTGAIDTCMKWGYAPWAGEADEKRAMLFGACLQAKRAAYYVGRGDLGSYTKPGTPILLRDSFGIHRDAIDDASLEAVWTPTGAKCFNWGHRRRPDMLPDGHPDGITMGACPPGVGLGVLSTGKATQSSTTD